MTFDERLGETIRTNIAEAFDEMAHSDPGFFAPLAFLPDRDYRRVTRHLCAKISDEITKRCRDVGIPFEIDPAELAASLKTELDTRASRFGIRAGHGCA